MDATGSRAVLIGVSAYEYMEFPPIRAARNSLAAMRSLLCDPALAAWPAGQVQVITNPISALDLAGQIADLAGATTGVLLLYYVGHGVRSADGELCLTVTSTHPGQPEVTGLRWDTVAGLLRGSPAHTRVAILDCCFAGQATAAAQASGEDPGLADLTDVDGVYTLTATTSDRAAHVPPPGQQDTACTSFTGELRDLIRDGIPGLGPQLTFGDIYPVLCDRLAVRDPPAPAQRGKAAGQFAFTANAAAVPGIPALAPGPAHSLGGSPAGPAPAAPAPAAPARHDRIVTEALLAAQSIPEENLKARALIAVAKAVAPADPDRATRLIADATRIAQSIAGGSVRAGALATVAGPLAASDADRAQTVAESIPEEAERAAALAGVAETLAGADADRSGRLIADAERVAQSVPGADRKAEALAAVAEALAAIDTDQAERVAQSISAANWRAAALATIARAVASTDADRAARLIADAERAARPIPGASSRAPALAAVGRALAVTDVGRAERLIADAERTAQSIPVPDRKGSALAAVAAALAAVDPEHAERLAQSILGASWRAPALAAVARALADDR
jgi:Caspase domain